MDWLYLPFRLFQRVPIAAFLPATLFLAAALGLRSAGSRPGRETASARASALVAGIGWALYGVWEAALAAADPGASIRVDLMLIAPLLLAVSGLSALLLVIAAARRR